MEAAAAPKGVAPTMSLESNEDSKDPDYIALHPPAQVVNPRDHFKTGANEGKWGEYDDRGVPVKTIKKKKLSKKEKDGLETEYLQARQKHQQYLLDYTSWEQKQVDAENELERTDRLRWAFRQVSTGGKQEPISVEELETFFGVMGWDSMSKREVTMLKKAADESSDDGFLSIEAIREFCKTVMPVRLLEDRLSRDDTKVEDYYSPRTWRRKLGDDDDAKKVKKGKKSKAADDGAPKSPRSGSKQSPRAGSKQRRGSAGSGQGGGASPRGSKSPSGGGTSPRGRGNASPRGTKSPTGATMSPTASDAHKGSKSPSGKKDRKKS